MSGSISISLLLDTVKILLDLYFFNSYASVTIYSRQPNDTRLLYLSTKCLFEEALIKPVVQQTSKLNWLEIPSSLPWAMCGGPATPITIGRAAAWGGMPNR